MPASRPAAVALFLAALVAAGIAAGSPARAAQSAAEPVAERASPGQHASAGQQLVRRSLSLIGVRYRFGGTSPRTGLDCSGLVQHVFDEALGFPLPRRSEEMSREGTPVPLDGLQPGDLVFFDTLRRAFSHVGIYIGENRFVHAPSSGGRVRVESIASRYWARRFNGARRMTPTQPPAVAASLYAADSARPAPAAVPPTLAERVFASPIIGAEPASRPIGGAAPAQAPTADDFGPRPSDASLLDAIYTF